MINALLGDFLPYILTALAGAAAVIVAYIKGGRDRDNKRDVEDVTKKIETSGRIDNALDEDDAARRNGDSWVERLRRAGH